MQGEISSRNVSKEYVCKVQGVFPEFARLSMIIHDPRKVMMMFRESVLCDKPIKVVSHKV